MKFRTHILYALIILCFTGCSDPDQMPEIPKGVLTPEEMRVILADFALAESAAIQNIKSVPLNKTDSVYAFDPLLDNKVRQSQFDSSIQFYSQHPELYKQVYDSVLVTLSEMKTRKSATVASPGSK